MGSYNMPFNDKIFQNIPLNISKKSQRRSYLSLCIVYMPSIPRSAVQSRVLAHPAENLSERPLSSSAHMSALNPTADPRTFTEHGTWNQLSFGTTYLNFAIRFLALPLNHLLSEKSETLLIL